MTDPRDLIRRLADAIDIGIPRERIMQSPLMVEVDAYLAKQEPIEDRIAKADTAIEASMERIRSIAATPARALTQPKPESITQEQAVAIYSEVMADPRDMIQRLVEALHNAIRVVYHEDGTQHISMADPVLAEARAYLAITEPAAGPTDEELMALAVQVFEDPFCTDKDYARAVLTRYGNRPSKPISPSERLPTEADCNSTGQCWACAELNAWGLVYRFELTRPNAWRAWLPHWALPVPGQEASHG